MSFQQEPEAQAEVLRAFDAKSGVEIVRDSRLAHLDSAAQLSAAARFAMGIPRYEDTVIQPDDSRYQPEEPQTTEALSAHDARIADRNRVAEFLRRYPAVPEEPEDNATAEVPMAPVADLEAQRRLRRTISEASTPSADYNVESSDEDEEQGLLKVA